MDHIPPEQLAILKAEDRGPMSVAIVLTFTIFAFICVSMRFISRTCFVRNVGLEDYCIAVSMIFAIIMAVCQVYQAKWGNGKHMMFLTLPEAQMILKYLYFSILTYCASLTLTKVSILLQYRRIFTLKEMRKPIYVVMGLCLAYGIESVLTGTFSCIPVDAFWDLMKKPTAKCVNENALYYANAALNVATDLLVAALPVKAIWDLKMPRRQKTALLMILTVGWFVCIVSILRLVALIELAKHPMDTTWYGTATAYWSAIEVNLAIVCASLPALKPLVVKIMPRFSSQRYGSDNSNQRGTKESRSARKSFFELKQKGSGASMSADLERGKEFDNITALPDPGNGAISGGSIHYSRDIEQYSEHVDRKSESSSQRDLVSQFPTAYTPGGRY